MSEIKRIDTHVHFRDGVQSYKETIAHGLEIAKSQGVEYVFDMPNTLPPIFTEDAVKKRLLLVPEKEKHRYFLHIGATSDENQIKEAISVVEKYPQVIGMKLYAGQSTGNLAVVQEEEQKKIYSTLAKNNYKGVITVHCEKEALMTNTFDYKNPITHALSRPEVAEIESVKDQIKFVKEVGFKGKLNIAHTSTSSAIDIVNKAKETMKIACEITPHHVLWNYDKMNEANGLLYKMNPPLRKEDTVKEIREQLKKGMVDFIGTDHAPHSVGEKLLGPYPSGYPSLYLYKNFVEEYLPSIGVSKEIINKMTFQNIVDFFELNLDA